VTGPDYQVAIIGGGPGGITAAHLLQERGITDFVIIERGGDFGGTWRDNRSLTVGHRGLRGTERGKDCR
jgi:cation diffusion facilitator CzcD-associated flavoprotein CzcO